MCLFLLGFSRDLSRQNLVHVAPTELNRPSRLVVSINMSLLNGAYILEILAAVDKYRVYASD